MGTIKSQKNSFDEIFLKKLLPDTKSDFSGFSGIAGAMALKRFASSGGIKIFITSTPERATDLYENLSTWQKTGEKDLLLFLPEKTSIYAQTDVDAKIRNDRAAAFAAQSQENLMILVPAQALIERFDKPAARQNSFIEVKKGDRVKRTQLLESLTNLGYKRTALTEEAGSFSVRGAIIDIFPSGEDFPVRIDFFGDEAESIKLFVPETQRTFDKISQTRIGPAAETIIDEKLLEEVNRKVSQHASTLSTTLRVLLERRLHRLNSSTDNSALKELIPFIEPFKASFFDYFDNCTLIAEDPDQLEAAIHESYNYIWATYEAEAEKTPLLSPDFYYHKPATIISLIEKQNPLIFSRFGKPSAALQNLEPLAQPDHSSSDSIIKRIKNAITNGWAIVLVISDENRLANLKGLMADRNIPTRLSPDPFSFVHGTVLLVKGKADNGFKDNDAKLLVISERDIYLKAAETRSVKPRRSRDILSMGDIIPGDLVVHAEHGVAEFGGFVTLTAANASKEYALLNYADADKLYVPADRLHKVTRYIGSEGFVPKIASLNSKVWANRKEKAKKNIAAIAKELLELYAKRQEQKGFSFGSDDDMQAEMENQFPYVETPDQMQAIIETKADMESDIPMDRLICGDVGYGKTEVAMRAAFKAVNSGKQVAILAPTTILVMQHYNNFKERLKDFPLTVDFVSKFKKPAEQKKAVEDTSKGKIDILIGTHRLLSKDIAFRDLGLLIIDEEQRFGVKHKEKLKQMKTNVDVLTLSATPIPRTLQMSLSGIRQISVINTPPRDRKPVNTYVSPFDETWIKRAVIEELKRGGQIYYVFNRVEKIDEKLAFLRNLLPEARIVTAHGQMTASAIEKNMLDFYQKKYDLLLCTTIIESGLDIPDVNTLIVDGAEKLGLAQLYQLRGRIGRSSRQATAYLFYSKGKKLTKDATLRLETIEEHTTLGSGLKIAMRDLQIRGAGNILGETQSGHIAEIGFALYMELLENAVAEHKGEKQKPDTELEIPVTAFFPATYIPEQEIRVEIYSRLAACKDADTVKDIKEECLDRFGEIPLEAIACFDLTLLRIRASEAGIKKISKIFNRLKIEFDKKAALPSPEKFFVISNELRHRIAFTADDTNSLSIILKDESFTSIKNDLQYFFNLLT
ncbi:MAG: transcription-repair coupling factor [Candidatus Riflebacteria bacterium]|nr:transcription-repair coupling factor [Candidatus Riflebacteria bacterium]